MINNWFNNEILRISLLNRNRIIFLHQQGCSQVEIAQSVKRSRNAVQQLIKKFTKMAMLSIKKKSGRPRK